MDRFGVLYNAANRDAAVPGVVTVQTLVGLNIHSRTLGMHGFGQMGSTCQWAKL